MVMQEALDKDRHGDRAHHHDHREDRAAVLD
jgi:hypothetical protein